MYLDAVVINTNILQLLLIINPQAPVFKLDKEKKNRTLRFKKYLYDFKLLNQSLLILTYVVIWVLGGTQRNNYNMRTRMPVITTTKKLNYE